VSGIYKVATAAGNNNNNYYYIIEIAQSRRSSCNGGFMNTFIRQTAERQTEQNI